MANEVGSGSEIYLEVDPILANETGVTHGLSYEVYISTPKLEISISLLNSIDVKRDYNGNVGDYITIDFLTYDSVYFRDIHPYKDNLEMTIISTTTDNEGNIIKQYTDRYKFVVMNQKATDTNILATQDRETMNRSGMRRVLGQCLDRTVEALKSATVNAIFRSTTVKDLMVSELANAGAYDIAVDGVVVNPSMTLLKEPDNTQTYDHIIVGATKGDAVGAKLLDLPSFLQNTKYGVYNGNIFTYYQNYDEKPSIFVGPLYDPDAYESSGLKRLLLIRTNDMRYDQVENTFMEDGDIVKVLVKSNVDAIDSGENEFISEGSSYTYTNPKAVIDRDINISGDTVTTDPSKRMATHTIKDRRDSNTATNYIGTVVNLYKTRSDYLKASMAFYQFQWISCDIDIIYPGMPVCYMYYENKRGIMKLYGIVQSTYSRYNGEMKSRVGIINIAVQKPVFKDNPEGDDHDSDILGG